MYPVHEEERSGDMFVRPDGGNIYMTVHCGNGWIPLWLHIGDEALRSSLNCYDTQEHAKFDSEDKYVGTLDADTMRELEKLLLTTVRGK